ncbi:flagellar hook-length control protein FliK [Sulfuricella denitrificans]|nr:flagellar hook-length control protein FliK [Sulfuricella denitrificans]
MPQLSITPAVSPQASAGISQVSALVAPATEAGDGLESASEINFGAVLTKQLRGIASLLEKKEDDGLSLAAANETAEPVANADAAVLPVDLSVLTAAMFVSVSPARAGAGAGIPAETDSEKPLIHLPKAGEIRLAAGFAANGKNLPPGMSPEQGFAGKLADLVEVPAGDTGGEFHSTYLPAAANPSATAVMFRNPEPLPTLPVAPRVGSAEWGGAVGEKVVWMANQSHQVAELRLNPPNLGPLEVRLTISNDQASALFVSHHSAVREAIETALPRLREMLADSGIMLGNVTVGSESFSQQQASDQRNGKEGNRGGLGSEGAIAPLTMSGRPAGLARDGMVDIFA